jgi:putative polyketide hydroxylase
VRNTNVQVLIVGAGAAGLTTASALAQRGVETLLVERRSERFVYPKARNLSFRSLEILRRLGLSDQVHAIADGVSDMVVKPALNSPDELPGLDIAEIFAGLADVTPEPPVQYCPQSRLEPILLDDARANGANVRYGTELVSFEQNDSGVTAVIREIASAEAQTIGADYLVAADGTRSPVREALGIRTVGHGPLPIYVVFIYFRGGWRKLIPHLAIGDAVQVVNDVVDGIVVGDEGDLGMFITTYSPKRGEQTTAFSGERGYSLLHAAMGEPVDLEIIETAAWQPCEQVADQFRSGRVFLVGDSAHTMPPLKAGGANCAIQSADNLTWKLAAVIKGQAGPGLLDTYHRERHPVGVFSARQSITGPTSAMLRADGDVPELDVGEEKPMFSILAGYQYLSTAVNSRSNVQSDASGIRLVDQLRGQPGTRVPHVWIRRSGVRISTLDLLGPDFTMLVAGDAEQWEVAAAHASAVLGVTIDVVGIGAGEICDADGLWTATTGLPAGGAVLVRPDEYVAWRAETRSENGQLAQVLSEILSRA